MQTAITIRVAPPLFSSYELPSRRPGEPTPDAGLSDHSDPATDDAAFLGVAPRPALSEGRSDLPPSPKRIKGGAVGPSAAEDVGSSAPDAVPFSLVFIVKEFRALLHFTTGIGCPIILYFSERGKFTFSLHCFTCWISFAYLVFARPLTITACIDNYLEVFFTQRLFGL
jgi:hypothetical protein